MGRVRAVGALFVVALFVFAVPPLSSAEGSIGVTVEQDIEQFDPTRDPSVRFVVTFSDVVNGFEPSDVVVEGSAGAMVAHLTPLDPTSYRLEVNAPASGLVRVHVPAGVVEGVDSTPNASSTSIDNEVTVDLVPPQVSIALAPGQADPTNDTTVRFAVQFSEPVQGFGLDDPVVSGSAAPVVTSVDEVTTSTYVVTVQATQDGVVVLSVPFGAAQDPAGNTSEEASIVDAEVAVLTAPLGVLVDQAVGQSDPVSAASVRFAVVFDRAVTGFDVDDLVIGGGAGATTSSITGGPAEFVVELSEFTSDGTVTVGIAPDAARDVAGNNSGEAVVVDGSVVVDRTAPAQVALVEPAAGAVVTSLTPALDWSDADDPTGATYTAQLDNSGCGFPSPELSVALLDQSTFAPPNNLPRTTYCWRIHAVDGAGNVSTSAPRSFTIGPGLPDAMDAADVTGMGRTIQSFGDSCAGDVNGDGHGDLFISNHGGAAWQLYHGSSSGQFTEAGVGNFPRNDRHGCTIADFNADGRADLYTTIGACAGGRTCNKRDELWLQNQGGGFVDVGASWGVADIRGRGRATAAFDFNHDAYPDLFVGNDVGVYYDSPNRVFVGGPSGMTELGSPVTAEIGAEAVAAADVDGDGWTDLVVGTGPRGAKLYRNLQGSGFQDVSATAGLGVIRSAWDVDLADLNRDGRSDLVVVERAAVHVLLNVNGRFPDIDFSLVLKVGRSAAVGDVDGDTYPDIYVVQGATVATNQVDILLLNDGDAHFAQVGGLPHTGVGGGDRVLTVANWRGLGRDGFLVTNGNTRDGPRQLVVFPGARRPVQPPPPPPPEPVVRVPSSVGVLVGTGASGAASALAANGGTQYSVKSVKPAGQSAHRVEWRADFANVPRNAPSISMVYRGSNSRSCTQQLSIWNWQSSAWVVLDTRAVGSTYVMINGLDIPAPVGDFISGTTASGSVRARVSCSGGTTVVTSKGDHFRLTVGT